jgi:ubiquinone/menaquinone biosynthesis C-methylase UbiE
MPNMSEIYQHHAAEYDELVNHEDYENNLGRALHTMFDFNDKVVCEYGCGTGRLTKLYIEQAAQAYCYDREPHMLARFQVNLAPHLPKISWGLLDNLAQPALDQKVDFVMEGWSFGHTIMDHQAQMAEVVATLVRNGTAVVKPEGTLIFIETLGSNSAVPQPPTPALADFYTLLETTHGFQRVVVKTDYRFADVASAERVFSFFFGAQMAQGIRERNSPLVEEFTGVWYKRLAG